MRSFVGLVLMILVSTHAVGQSDDKEVLVRALQDEMDRSLSELKLENEPKPYFISYSVRETTTSSSTFVLGAHDGARSNRVRVLTVKIRVGSKMLDNTNFLVLGGNSDPAAAAGGFHVLPLTDDYDQLRRGIWVATDQAYKEAIASFSAKKSMFASQVDRDRPNDFNDEEPFTYESSAVPEVSDLHELADLARELSSVFRGRPQIFSSYAIASSSVTDVTYLDSEGNFHSYAMGLCSIRTHAETQSVTGIEIKDGTSAQAKDCSSLPELEVLKNQVGDMAEHLVVLRSAEALESYSGPVFLESKAAAEFISQALAGLLVAVPSPTSNAPQFDAQAEQMVNSFVPKVGTRVFPRSINVVNDPTLSEFDGKPLLGSYAVDSEGMPSRRTELISNGRLNALLTTRSPVGTFNRSTGSHRRLPTPLPGSLFITAEGGLSNDELKEQMLEIAESNRTDFALVIRKIANTQEIELENFEMSAVVEAARSGSIAVLPAIHVVKIYADGSEVPVQPMVIEDFVPSHFRDIVATTGKSIHYDVPVSPFVGLNVLMVLAKGLGVLAGYDQTVISIVTPGLLFEDLDLRNASGQKPKLPLVSHPMSEN